MSDLKDFKNKNTEFTGTSGIDLPEGNTAERVDQQGRLRFNTQTGLAEYYNGVIWKSIDAPPGVQSVSPVSVDTDGSTLFTITVTGIGFDNGGITGTFVGADGTTYSSAVNTFNSSTEVEIQTTANMTAANGPYDVTITNTGSSLSGTLTDALSGGDAPTFTTAAGSLGTVFQGQNASELSTQTIVAEDPDGGDVTFSITSGALPAGFILNPNNGEITGTITESDQDLTFNFTVQISDGINTATRSFSIDQDLTPTMEVLVVAGGGGGGGGNRQDNNYSGCGGGGAGGYRTGNISIGSSRTYTITVGSGGSGGPGGNVSAQSGTSSSIAAPSISTITSAGGGYGGRETEGGANGGSGGGGGARNGEGPGAGTGGSGNTPSTAPSQGSNAGSGANSNGGGGGGGASQAGAGGIDVGNGAAGGNGTANDITGPSVTYAGGGGGGIHGPPGNLGPGGTGGGGTGGRHNGPENATAGAENLGGGGGGSGPANAGTGTGGAGGTGVVILRLPTAQYSGTTTGSPTVTTDGTDTIVKFTGSGSITT
jgi:hypothetical protein